MNSTLALQKRDYESEVGDFMGWGRGEHGGDEDWPADKVIKIQMDVKSGLRRFYYCSHPWSFLNPMAETILASGTTSTVLPDDFGGIDGGTKATLLNSNQTYIRPLWFTGPQRVTQAEAELSESTGCPRIIAIRPVKGMASGKMQRWELAYFPETDQAYTLAFPYFVTPDYLLDVTQPFAYGGVEHHETILESCLAVAEMRRDNNAGVHAMEFQRLLAMSIAIDRRKQPTNLGPSYDSSDGVDWDKYNGHGYVTEEGVLINGVRYT